MSDPVGANYAEPARTYRGLPVTGLVLLVGFGCDALLGGALAHLAGWLAAAAVVVGAHALFVRAARSTHSLRIDEDGIRVGDQAIARDEVVGAQPGIAVYQPVLGWTTAPKNPRGVSLRLRDGRDVGVLTRRPDRVLAALGVGAVATREAPVRPATPADLPALADVDARAEVLFRVGGYALPTIDVSLDPPKAVFVIGDPPEAFVWLTEVDGAAHVAEISVVPNRMRQGLGTRLMREAERWARASGYDAITLTTFAEVPWNAPWYRTLGYREWVDLGPGLAAIRANEREIGLDAVTPRIAMRRELAGT